MKMKFEEWKPRGETLLVVYAANKIITEYQNRGYSLTLRQLYYQFVARDLIPNKQSEYKRLGDIVNKGRVAGLIDWAAIEDRTRNLSKPSAWTGPADIIAACVASYKENPWIDQPAYCEVWVEKEALAGVIEAACEPLRVPFFSCRGYVSQSEQFGAGQRLKRQALKGKRVVIFHLGDHDPSGIDMTRDNLERLRQFGHSRIEVRRLALNSSQIEEHNPPPNPAKETDSRFEGYRRAHGHESWELDALNPDLLVDLITDAVNGLIEPSAWDQAMAAEEMNKAALENVQDRWEDVIAFLDESAPDDEA